MTADRGGGSPAGGRLGTRLRRILVMLPYAIRNPGVTVDELAARFGASRSEIKSDLDLVFMCGLPGYGPGDLIDVALADDRVYVGMADYFSAPLRLTAAEALALHSGAAALAELPGMDGADALRRAVAKLGRALGGPGREPAVEVRFEAGSSAHLATVREALACSRRLRLEYRSATRSELTERTVEPWGLVGALGRWYLVGWDHLSSDERMFRLDRIKSAAVLDEPADVPGDFDPGPYRSAFREGPGQPVVRFEISPAAASWFEDYYPVRAARDLQDGWREVELAAGSERWAAVVLLGLGRDVRAVRPRSVADAARSVAASIASRHRP